MERTSAIGAAYALPKTAFLRFPPLHGADLEGRQGSILRLSPNERHFGRPGSTLAHRPTVHGAAPVQGWRNVDKKLIVLAAAEFQELAWPFVSGKDPAAHSLAGDRSRP